MENMEYRDWKTKALLLCLFFIIEGRRKREEEWGQILETLLILELNFQACEQAGTFIL